MVIKFTIFNVMTKLLSHNIICSYIKSTILKSFMENLHQKHLENLHQKRLEYLHQKRLEYLHQKHFA